MDNRLKNARLHLCGIELIGFHGWRARERRRGNRFRVDLVIEGDFDQALRTDQLKDTIDYSAVAKTVREINKARNYFLIESLANAIADGLMKRFHRIEEISVRVAKLQPPGLGTSSYAMVEITKQRGQ